MNIVDAIYLILLLLFCWKGFSMGLIQSAIGPACLLVWSILGIIHYDVNYNILGSVLFVLIGSSISFIILAIFFYQGRKNISEEYRKKIFVGSRLAGSALNTFWYGVIILIILAITLLMPNNVFGLKPIQEKISTSISYNKFYRYLIRPYPVIENIHLTIAIFGDKELLENFSETKEYKSLFSDPKTRYLTEDPFIVDKIFNKNAISLLRDPMIWKILQDEELMLKVSNLAKRIFEVQNEEKNSEE